MNPLFYLVNLYGETFAWPKRREVITQALIPFLAGQQTRTLLDVGCGDGKMAQDLEKRIPDLSIHGVDTCNWPGVRVPIPYSRFDGLRLPFADKTFDTCLIIDVLHHSRYPEILLEEAGRVARTSVIVKDHDVRGRWDFLLMKWGDWLGNRMSGMDLPYNFKTWEEFENMFIGAGLSIRRMDDRLKPAGNLEMHHHFLVELVPRLPSPPSNPRNA